MMNSKRQSGDESERKIWKKVFKVREESVQLAFGSVYVFGHEKFYGNVSNQSNAVAL